MPQGLELQRWERKDPERWVKTLLARQLKTAIGGGVTKARKGVFQKTGDFGPAVIFHDTLNADRE
jgi:chloramphenicol O-acetyltransferase